MDSITHTVLGACTGQMIAGKQIGKKAMLIGAIVNNLPDIDMIANFWNSEAQSLLSHRGITHSFLFITFIAPLLILLFKKWFRSATIPYRQWLFLVAHGLVLHVLLDSCTTYGTGLFEPFSHERVSFNTLFIMDLFFMAPMLIGSIVLLILKAANTKRSIVAGSALLVSLVYLVCAIGLKSHVNKVAEKNLEEQDALPTTFISSPAPFTSFLWYVAAKKSSDYKIGYYSVFDRDEKIEFTPVSKKDSLLNEVRTNEDVACLLRFTKDYYTVSRTNNGLRFSDLRFGPNSITTGKDLDFVFSFDIVKQGEKIEVTQSPFKEASKADLKKLIDRIKGKKD